MPDQPDAHGGAAHANTNPTYVPLREGRAYRLCDGSPDGEPLVLVHGATVPSWEFDALVPPLLRAGFRTLRFDLYGHGASDRPPGAYTFERFTRQLIEMLDVSGVRRATLLGHSFGAAVVAAVAAARPDLASRLVLVAPMLDFGATLGWATLLRVPVLGDVAMRVVGVPGLVRRRRRRYEAIGRPELTARFVEQVSAPGFGRALLSMFRSGALGDKRACYRALHSFEGELLLITGDRDAIIPAEHIAIVRSLLPPHTHRSVAAEHNLLLTHPEIVVGLLEQWGRWRRAPDVATA